MMVCGIDIPAFGCWEITGHYMDQDLTFVVWVMPFVEPESPSGVLSAQEPSPAYRNIRKIHVDPDVQKKSLVYEVTPQVPHEAQVIGVSGSVVLHAVIGEDGRVHEVQYRSGSPLLAQAAIDAVQWWQYMFTDEGVEVDTEIEVTFR
jgi:TonB family protein